MMRSSFFFLVVSLWSLHGLIAQQATLSDLTTALQVGFALSGSNGPSSVNWIDGGDRFSYIDDAGKVRSYNPATDEETLIFDSEGKTFPDRDEPFEYQSFQWSADFKYLLFQTNFRPVWRYSGEADYYLYHIEQESFRLVAKDARTAELSPDGKKVVYERGGNLFVLDLSSDKETQLTDDAQEQVYNGRFGWVYEEEYGLVQAWAWSPDSRYIAYWQTDERDIPIYRMTDFSSAHPEYEEIPYPRVGDPIPGVRIGILDIAKKKNTQWVDLDLEGGTIPRIYWTANEGQLALVHLNRPQNHLTLYFADAKNGKVKKIIEEKDDSGWIDVFDFFAGILHYFSFPEDREEFLWISGRSGHNHIYHYNYDGELLNQVTEGAWDVVTIEATAWSEGSGNIYFTSTEVSPLERHLYVVNADGTGKKRLTRPPGRHSIDMGPNGNYYIDNYSNVDQYRQVELRSTAGSRVKILEDNASVEATLDRFAYAPRELFSFTTSDGQELDGYLIRPIGFDSTQSYPLFLNIYGGPGAQSVYNQFGSNGFEQFLAANGYVIASVNNRGSGGYGQDFMQVVYKQLGKYESLDFVETAKHLSGTYDWIDGERMAIRGHSYGGYASSYTMVTHPGVFDVALVGAPVTDQRLYDNIYTERYMGLLEDNEEGYIQAAPITHAENLEGKMLIAHSLMDDNVHVINTYQFIEALTNAGKDVDLRIYPPGNHGVAYNFSSYILLHQTYFDFLEENLVRKTQP